MNTQEVKALLEKYYEGQASDEEEAILRDYFCNNKVSQELETEQDMFIYYQSLNNTIPQPDQDFEQRIIRALDQSHKTVNAFRLRRLLTTVVSSAAAVILIILSITLFRSNQQMDDTFNDPAIAYVESMKVLAEVSSKLTKGIDQLKPVKSVFSRAASTIDLLGESTGKINTGLRPLNDFQDALEIVNSPLERTLGRK